jgi:ATP-dependent Lon protease
MIRIETKGYSVNDKINIAQKHIIPEMLEEYGFKHNDLIFNESIIKTITNLVESESGVRNLKRGLQEIISNINLSKFMDQDEKEKIELPYTVSESDVRKYIKKSSIDSHYNLLYT